MNLPGLKVPLIDHLRLFQKKYAYSNAALGVVLAAFGWGASHWSTVHIDDLMSGRVRLSDAEEEFITQALLTAFYTYNSL